MLIFVMKIRIFKVSPALELTCYRLKSVMFVQINDAWRSVELLASYFSSIPPSLQKFDFLSRIHFEITSLNFGLIPLGDKYLILSIRRISINGIRRRAFCLNFFLVLASKFVCFIKLRQLSNFIICYLSLLYCCNSFRKIAEHATTTRCVTATVDTRVVRRRV